MGKKKNKIKELEQEFNEKVEEISEEIYDASSEVTMIQEKMDNNGVNITIKELTTTLKVSSIIANIFNVTLIIFIVIFSIYSFIETKNHGIREIINNKYIVNYVELANTLTEEDAVDIILGYQNSSYFLFIEILLPSVILIITLASLYVFWLYVYKLVNNVRDNYELFTNGKVELVRRMRNIISLASLVFILIFGLEYIVIWVLVEMMMEAFLYVFNYAVTKTNRE